MHVEHCQISLNDEKHEAFMEAVRDLGSKAEVIKTALIAWLSDEGYLLDNAERRF